MASVIGNYGTYPARSGNQEVRSYRANIAIGASGAATVTGFEGFTCVKNTTGVYDVTFPSCPAAGNPTIQVGIQKSAVPTVAMATILAVDFSAGTMQFKTALATPGTGVEPANGDKLWLELNTGVSGV